MWLKERAGIVHNCKDEEGAVNTQAFIVMLYRELTTGVQHRTLRGEGTVWHVFKQSQHRMGILDMKTAQYKVIACQSSSRVEDWRKLGLQNKSQCFLF